MIECAAPPGQPPPGLGLAAAALLGALRDAPGGELCNQDAAELAGLDAPYVHTLLSWLADRGMAAVRRLPGRRRQQSWSPMPCSWFSSSRPTT